MNLKDGFKVAVGYQLGQIAIGLAVIGTIIFGFIIYTAIGGN